MSLRGTGFDAVELILYDIDKRGPKHKIMCNTNLKIEAVNCLGPGTYICVLTCRGLFWHRFCLSVWIKIVTAAVRPVPPFEQLKIKNKFIWLPWKCIKGVMLLIDSAVEQTSVLLSKQFPRFTNNSRWNLLVPLLSLFSLFLFLRPPLPFLGVDHQGAALALSIAVTPLKR